MKVRSKLYVTYEDILNVKHSLLQIWTRPKDSRSLRLPDFKTIGT